VAFAREGRWSEAIAVGNLNFVEKVKSELGFKAAHRGLIEGGGTYALWERREPYGSNFTGKNEVLSSENTRFWNENSEFYGDLAWSDPGSRAGQIRLFAETGFSLLLPPVGSPISAKEPHDRDGVSKKNFLRLGSLAIGKGRAQ
jgi:hypothetical protein